MSAVFISRQTRIDLDNIVIGLLDWEKIILTVAEVEQYVDDIVEVAYSLNKKSIHFRAIYNKHLKYGTYVYPYKRNANTTWYIIYNKIGEDIYIEKIISNHLTSS